MNFKLSVVLLISVTGLTLGGCTEVTEYFADNPAVVSSCANLPGGGEGLLCVECNSASNSEAEDEMCGMSLTARCNSNGEWPEVYGIAVGAFAEGGAFKTATGWVDNDGTAGPSGGDEFICHEQAVGYDQLKHESKCGFPLKGNGKNDGVTFEAEIKYDPEKDDC